MIDFKLPSLGADMDEGTLLEWKVKPGDTVKKGQVVAIVDTTKAAVDVECWQAGTVAELLIKPGEKIPVDTVLATLLEAGEKLPENPMAKVGAGGTAQRASRVSPVARKRAADVGLDLATVIGTGAHGAITLADVERAAAKLPQPPSIAAAHASRQADIRQTIAAAMARSKREIPHYYLSETLPMARALSWMTEQNASLPMTERLLPAVLLLKAVAVVLPQFPQLNGFYRDDHFEPADGVHVGVAISLRQGGLIAPALLNTGERTLKDLMQGLTDLVQRARSGSLKSSEMSEPTVTVTNLGDQGSEVVFGIIYPPQTALIGFGRIQSRPWVTNGAIHSVPLITVSLAADHRVTDGHYGARFLNALTERLQAPESLQ